MKKFLSAVILAALFLSPDVTSAQENSDNYIVMETSEGNYEGRWNFYIALYDDVFVPGFWVDWNMNGTEDEGEELVEDDWINGVDHELTSKKIVVHGDVKYISIYQNGLTGVDVSHTDVLEVADFSGNLITSFDLSGNKSIRNLMIGENPLKSIDLVNAPQLEVLNMSMNSDIKELDISAQKALREFVFTDNDNISDFDLSPNKNLEFLYLEYLPIEKIDLTDNKKLTTLRVASSQLTDITMPDSDNLEFIELFDDKLSGTMDVSEYKKLTEIYIHGNNINRLVIPENSQDLYTICCFMNDLQSENFKSVIDALYDRDTAGMDRAVIIMVDSEPEDGTVVDKNSLTETLVDEGSAKGWDFIDYAGAQMYPYIGVDDDASGIDDVDKEGRRMQVLGMSGTVVVKVSPTLLGNTLNVFDASGALVFKKKVMTDFMRIPELYAHKGILVFKVAGETMKINK